jgi:hypothetical protein
LSPGVNENGDENGLRTPRSPPKRHMSKAIVNLSSMGISQAIRNELTDLVQRIIDGEIDEPVATLGTGLP